MFPDHNEENTSNAGNEYINLSMYCRLEVRQYKVLFWDINVIGMETLLDIPRLFNTQYRPI